MGGFKSSQDNFEHLKSHRGFLHHVRHPIAIGVYLGKQKKKPNTVMELLTELHELEGSRHEER